MKCYVNDLAIAILVVVTALLAADCIWLHVTCRRQSKDLAALAERLELHVNPPKPPHPPQDPSFADKAKETYEKVKSAAVKGYKAAKEELDK